MLAARPKSFSYQLPERDDAGGRALSELRDRGLNLVANAAAQAGHHVMSFFKMLRFELAFYVGCLNLHATLASLEESVCFPVPSDTTSRVQTFTELYDPCLVLSAGRKVVGNDLAADGMEVAIVTGANQGGKSTFLRSVGLAQLMMQCGMFVAARAFAANICERIFTHYKREEDATMSSGKLDEELSRMSDIAAHVVPNSLVLFNESFAATNEREGSEIARQVTTALMERRIKAVFVTHQYEFARGFDDRRVPNVVFLRAERQDDGRRTFKIMKGRPLPTSYGEDLYRQIFGPATIEPVADDANT
jgi:DNA mismatch repair ATPase MutS